MIFHIFVDALAGQSDNFLVSLFPNTICHIFVLQMASAFLQCVFSRPILLTLVQSKDRPWQSNLAPVAVRSICPLRTKKGNLVELDEIQSKQRGFLTEG